MSNELMCVQFHGDEIEAVRNEVGEIFVVLKRLCENLGMGWSGDVAEKVRTDGAMRHEAILIPSPGGAQRAFCLHLDSVHGWLFSISTARVAPSIRDKLIAYKRECHRVLREHFAPRPADDLNEGRAMRSMLAVAVQALQQNTQVMQAMMAGMAPRARAAAPERPEPEPRDLRSEVLSVIRRAIDEGRPLTSVYQISRQVVRRRVLVLPVVNDLLAEGVIVHAGKSHPYLIAPARQTSFSLAPTSSPPPMFTRCQACEEEIRQPAGARNLHRYCNGGACIQARRKVRTTADVDTDGEVQ